MAKKFDFLSPGIELREIDQSFIPAERDAEGPIIIGRTRKGPANKPVKVKNLDDFISVFGAPVPGGTADDGDIWRNGNTTGPTYASYAAQAWLASEESPVIMVRIAGEEHPGSDGTAAGTAGWQLSGTPSATVGSNSTAYGLFLFQSASTEISGGVLAAVLYADSGYMTISGALADNSKTTSSANTFVKSSGENYEFVLNIYNSSGNLVEAPSVNFSRNSSKYIRSVLNTNPQLVNTTVVATEDQKSYWLGESYVREVLDSVPTSTAGTVLGLLAPLATGTAATANWGYRRGNAREAKSGWVISQKSTNQVKLFRVKSLHVGEDIQKNYMIAIEDVKEPTNPNVDAYGSFTVCVKNMAGTSVERYSGLNLNPSSPNYIAKRIGDQYLEWDNTDRRYRTIGDFANASDIIYIEVAPNIADGGGQGLLPAGFYGPVRPKGFTLIKTGQARTLGVSTKDGGEFPANFLAASGTVPAGNDRIFSVTNFTASVTFPALNLRVSGTDGGAPDPYRAYWGIRPKISSTSTANDPDYIDYLRGIPGDTDGTTSHIASGNNEYSFIFTLDDVIIRTGSANRVEYASGSHTRANHKAWTAGSGTFGEMLDLGVRQFLMPLWGGTEGFDITEKEPLRNSLFNDTTNEPASYVEFSVNKAIDSVRDSEVVRANLLLAPGFTKPLITNKLIRTADARRDVLAIIDLEGDYIPRYESSTNPPERGSVTTAVSNIKGRNLNSSYACAFYPWIQISDNINGGQLVWVPPSVAGLGAMARSQAQSDVWFAPAGFNRGGLGSLGGSRGPGVTQARQRLDSGERDRLYEVNINPIATFPAEGVVIFGQKTLQAGQSALDRINVRRLLLYLKSKVGDVSRNILFDQNLDSTWARFKSQVLPILSDVKARFGLADFKLILDETTTTADLVDRNIMYAKIYIKPARAIEFIVVDFIITRSGADFV